MGVPPSHALLARALDELPDLVQLAEAVRDGRGRAVDIRVIWVNHAWRRTSAPLEDVGGVWSELYPGVRVRGSLARALSVLDGKGSTTGRVDAVDASVAGPKNLRNYEYRGVLIDDDTLLWVVRDLSTGLLHEGPAEPEHELRRAMVRLQSLQDMTAGLSRARTLREVATVVRSTAFPVAGAQDGGLALLEPGGRSMRILFATGSQASRFEGAIFSTLDDNPLTACVLDGRALYLRTWEDVRGRWPKLSVMVQGQGRAYLPLRADRTLGALSLIWETVRDFPPDERQFIEAVAAQCAQAIERAQLFESQARTARELQRALLPVQLPTLPGIETAARYLPAGGDAVGGDWYDVIPLPQGAIGLVMGDVEGHSSVAAAIMGQARNVLRAYAVDGHTPAEVLARVNRFVVDHTDALITCCYLELRPAQRTVTAVSAGHPAPFVLDQARPFGGWPVRMETSPPLGVNRAAHYPEQTTVLPAGCLLALFTDGLVDDQHRALHRGAARFVERAAELADGQAGDLQAIADGLVARDPEGPDLPDDAALLLVRLTGGVSEHRPAFASRVFARDPATTPAARHFVHDVLGGWRLHELCETAELLTSELITNAVIHTMSEVRLTLRRTGACRVWIGVQDDSDRWPEQHRARPDDIAGRGLTIVNELADEWGVEPTPDGAGKTVWLQLFASAT